jgi:hypothetical protein
MKTAKENVKRLTSPPTGLINSSTHELLDPASIAGRA